MTGVTLPTEPVFVMEMSPIKFGLGATDEIGHDARRLGVQKVLLVTDPHVAELGLSARVAGLLGEQGVKAEIYDGVEVEPTDRSIEEAADYVLGIWRSDLKDGLSKEQRQELRGQFKVRVLKSRNGPRNKTVTLRFEDSILRISSIGMSVEA